MFSGKIMSLLNQFIPVSLAMKGLEKVDPRLKSFIGAATGFGYGANEIIDYLRSKAHTASQKENRHNLEQSVAQGTARPDEAANLERLNQSEVPGDILQSAASLGAGALGGLGAAGLLKGGAQGASAGLQSQTSRAGAAPAEAEILSSKPLGAKPSGRGRPQTVQAPQNSPSDIFLKRNPELGMFLEKKINEGLPPAEAAKRAKSVTKFKSKISKLESDLGQPFEGIVAQVFGGGQPQGDMTQDIAQLRGLMQQWTAMRGKR